MLLQACNRASCEKNPKPEMWREIKIQEMKNRTIIGKCFPDFHFFFFLGSTQINIFDSILINSKTKNYESTSDYWKYFRTKVQKKIFFGNGNWNFSGSCKLFIAFVQCCVAIFSGTNKKKMKYLSRNRRRALTVFEMCLK